MVIDAIDHLVLTVRDLPTSIAFYTQVLGMREITFGDNRKALIFGQCKLNLHLAGHELEPKAAAPTPGSADLCLLTLTPLDSVIQHLTVHQISIEAGPVERTGASGPILSIYVRDPDGNLVELSNPQ